MGYSRPIYETEADRDNERKVMRHLEDAAGMKSRQLPKRYPADLIAFSANDPKKPVMFVEVKSRKITFGTYSCFHISAEKLAGLRGLRSVTGLHTAICANLLDGIYFFNIPDNEQFAIEMGGRTDRNDPEDVEPVCCIPWKRFKSLTA